MATRFSALPPALTNPRGASALRAFHSQLVVQPGGFEIEVDREHLLPEARQIAGHVGDHQGAADAALVGIEGEGLQRVL